MNATQKLKNLPLPQILDLLTSLGKGNGEHPEKPGVAISAADLAEIQPDGKTGALVDGLEKRAYFLLVREVRVAILRALPGAIRALGSLSEAPASNGAALALVPLNGILAPHRANAPLAVVEAYEKLTTAMEELLPVPALMKEKREAALALFSLAKDLGVYDLAKAYKEDSEQDNLEAKVRAREAELGMIGDDEDDL